MMRWDLAGGLGMRGLLNRFETRRTVYSQLQIEDLQIARQYLWRRERKGSGASLSSSYVGLKTAWWGDSGRLDGVEDASDRPALELAV